MRSHALLLAAAALLLARPSAGEKYLYWTDTAGRLVRSPVASPEAQILSSTPPAYLPPCCPEPAGGVAVDAAAGVVYYGRHSASNATRIYRASLDGDEAAELLSTDDGTASIELDVAAQRLFWSARHIGIVIETTHLTGPGALQPEPVGNTNQTSSSRALALDPSGGKVYNSHSGYGAFLRIVEYDTWSPTTFVPLHGPERLALDETNGKLYMTTRLDENNLRRSDLDGSNLEVLLSDLAEPVGLAVDPAAGKVYIGNTTNGEILVANLDGSGLQTFLSGVGEVSDIEVADLPAGLGQACRDGLDNDGDGLVDWPDDPGCRSAFADDELMADSPCDDGLDNDGDGLVDAADPGCASPWWPAEDPECNDGIDNDGDGDIDLADIGCTAGAQHTQENPECSDGLDNDSDGDTDYPADGSCDSPSGTAEVTACSDGVDNDSDGLTDFPADPECLSGGQIFESTPACGLGAELVLLALVAGRIRRRRV